jgi:ribosome recycling factor
MNLTIDNLMKQLKESMEKSLEAMVNDFSGIRTGKASPALVENILVDYYGNKTRLKELAGITTPEPRLIVIQPWDTSAVHAVEKAIMSSNIGISPVSDGRILRLPIPELSEERRAQLAKQVKNRAEEARVSIRNIRRDGNDTAKKAQKDSAITEDDLKDILDDIQKLTDSKIKKIDVELENKEKELMSV